MIRRWLVGGLLTRALRRAGRPLRSRARTQLPALIEFAERFLRAGGRVTLSEFASIPAVEAVALVTAGDRLEAERAARWGIAARSPAGGASVFAAVDGGKAGARLLARAGLEALKRG